MITYRSFVSFLTLLSAVLWAAPAAGQEDADADPLVVPRAKTPITLDGHIEQNEWQHARRLPLAQRFSDFGAKPDLETEILVTYTDEHLYVACRCYDPEDPTVTGFERDQIGGKMDGLTVLLDTFNDEQNGVGFFTTPAGTRTDAAIFNDAAGATPAAWFDRSWNTYWDVEVRQTEDGWFAEMRIPVSSLRFEATGDRVVMGLTTWRWVARKYEMYMFPAISMEHGTYGMWKPSQARDVAFNAFRFERPLRVTPYVLGGATQQSHLNGRETAYDRLTDRTYDAGLDVKYGLTSNLTLDLTVNTDFAQVEADNQQVNLTRFPLFFPEKRRFFLERSSNFAFGFGGPNRLFYSRRIGLHGGQQVRILGGARLVGRMGQWDLGALSMQTGHEPELAPAGEALPSENFSALRLQREVLNKYSQVGGIMTSRVGMDGTYNVAYGLDGTIRPFGDQYVSARWAQTFTDHRPEGLLSLQPARMHLLWERRTYGGLSYDLRYDRAGRRYEPGLGFELWEDYFRLGDRIGYGWLPEQASLINQHQLNLRSEAFFRNEDGTLQSLRLGPEWSMSTNSGHSVTAGAFRRVEDLRVPFPVTGDVAVPPGRYAFDTGELSYETPGHYTVGIQADLIGGGYFDGRRVTAQISPVWNPSRYVQVDGFNQLNRVVFPERDEAFTAHVSRLRVNITPNVEHSVLAFLQHNSARGVVVANVRYRYNPRQGNDLYLVYNERLNTDRNRLGPRPPLSSQRAVLMKYTYTFNW